jgi:hypothetical protein
MAPFQVASAVGVNEDGQTTKYTNHTKQSRSDSCAWCLSWFGKCPAGQFRRQLKPRTAFQEAMGPARLFDEGASIRVFTP